MHDWATNSYHTYEYTLKTLDSATLLARLHQDMCAATRLFCVCMCVFFVCVCVCTCVYVCLCVTSTCSSRSAHVFDVVQTWYAEIHSKTKWHVLLSSFPFFKCLHLRDSMHPRKWGPSEKGNNDNSTYRKKCIPRRHALLARLHSIYTSKMHSSRLCTVDVLMHYSTCAVQQCTCDAHSILHQMHCPIFTSNARLKTVYEWCSVLISAY